jgi:CDP-4-dehydro-6-deoxyglucose reductase, E3
MNVMLLPIKKEFQSSGDLTVLEAALSQGLNLPYSCKNGDCNSCSAKLISGVIESIDGELITVNEDSNKPTFILTCQCKVKSDCVLHVDYYPELDDIVSCITPTKVHALNFPNPDIAILTLRLAQNAVLNFLPGQFVDFLWEGNKRSYSIASRVLSEKKLLEFHIRRVVGGFFSQIIFEQLKVDQLLRIVGPQGTFFLHESEAPIILLAGGTGFAPIKSIMEQLITSESERTVVLYWGGSKPSLLYSDLPQAWSKDYDWFTYVPVISVRDDTWSGRFGLVHEAVMEDTYDLSPYHVYVCGAPRMIGAAQSDFIKHGLDADNFYADAFTSTN